MLDGLATIALSELAPTTVPTRVFAITPPATVSSDTRAQTALSARVLMSVQETESASTGLVSVTVVTWVPTAPCVDAKEAASITNTATMVFVLATQDSLARTVIFEHVLTTALVTDIASMDHATVVLASLVMIVPPRSATMTVRVMENVSTLPAFVTRDILGSIVH